MKNKYEIRGDVTAIFVGYKGKEYETLIDTVDLERALQFPNTWYTTYEARTDSLYVRGSITENKKRRTIQFHRFLFEAPDDMEVDHVEHNTLDNRREKTRVITRAQNIQNRKGVTKRNTSGYRGVYWHKYHKKWNATVRINKKDIPLGLYDNVEEAAKAAEEARATYMPYSKEALATQEDEKTFIPNYLRKEAINNLSGIKNVHWNRFREKWVVRFVVNKKDRHFGSYDDLEDAKIAAEIARGKIKNKNWQPE